MNTTIKYSEVLKQIKQKTADYKQDITVVCNVTLEPVYSDYLTFYDNSLVVEYMDITSYLSTQNTKDTVVVLLEHSGLNTYLYDNFYKLTKGQIDTECEKITQQLNTFITPLSKNHKQIYFFTFVNDYGDYTPKGQNDYQTVITQINQFITEQTEKYPNIHLIDTQKIITKIGADNFYDDRGIYLSNAPYSKLGCNALAYETVQTLNMLCKPQKKCLILDCDNVLWGGIVSEDGIENIRLSRQYIGKAYRDFQREVVKLYHQGVIICLCSKNDEHDVWQVFNNHPDMLLKKEHITASQINWNNKADNIKSIADTLGISTDSMVYIDDSSYEIGLINQVLPEVTTMWFNQEKPHNYARTLRKCHLFYKEQITSDDEKRNDFYKSQTKRELRKQSTTDMEMYHRSLQTKITIEKADLFAIPRIADMSQRTNQFNLSAKRYTQAEITAYTQNPNYDVLYLKAEDIFGDMGIVGACVVEYRDNKAIIEAFMISCRVFCRGFEDELLQHIKKNAKVRGCKGVCGVYTKTEKNKKYHNFYADNGVDNYE